MLRSLVPAVALLLAATGCKQSAAPPSVAAPATQAPSAEREAVDPNVVPDVLRAAVNLPAPPFAVVFTLPKAIEAQIDPASGQAIMWSFIEPEVGGIAVTWTALSRGDLEFMDDDPMEFFGSRATGGEGTERIDSEELSLDNEAQGRLWRSRLGDAEQTAVVIHIRAQAGEPDGAPAPIVGFVVGIVMMGSPGSGWTLTGEKTLAVLDSIAVVPQPS